MKTKAISYLKLKMWPPKNRSDSKRNRDAPNQCYNQQLISRGKNTPIEVFLDNNEVSIDTYGLETICRWCSELRSQKTIKLTKSATEHPLAIADSRYQHEDQICRRKSVSYGQARYKCTPLGTNSVPFNSDQENHQVSQNSNKDDNTNKNRCNYHGCSCPRVIFHVHCLRTFYFRQMALKQCLKHLLQSKNLHNRNVHPVISQIFSPNRSWKIDLIVQEQVKCYANTASTLSADWP